MPLPLFSPNEKAIHWRGDKSCFFTVILCCHKDYAKRSFILNAIKCVLCACMHKSTHKGSVPTFCLIDATSLLPDKVAAMHSMLQFVSCQERHARINVTAKYTRPVLVNKNSSGIRQHCALIHDNYMQGKCVFNASDSMHRTAVKAGFFVSMSSFCEGVLSLVNYT